MRVRVFAALLTIAGVGAVALVLAMKGTAAGAPPSQQLTFRDHHQSALTFAIETQAGRPDTGSFVLRAPDGRVFVSRGQAELRAVSPTSTILRYESVVDVIAAGPTLGEAVARLSGQIDASHHTAEITLDMATERFHLVQPAVGRGEVGRILGSFERAMTANDWTALYGIASTDITSSYTLDAFVAAARSQQASVGKISSLRRLTTSEIQTNPAGITFFVATYEIRRAPGAVVPSATYDVYFVMEADWHLWFTAQR